MESHSKSRFLKINESFVCEHCTATVPPSKRTCRNHCPYCLHSKHVDIFPGDRDNSCHGLLVPTGYELSGKKGLVLLFRCDRCGEKTRNVALLDDPYQADDYQAILALSLPPP